MIAKIVEEIIPKCKPDISKSNSDKIKELSKVVDRNFSEVREKDNEQDASLEEFN